MGEHIVTMQAGGLAQWGRQVSLPHSAKVVSYECDLMTKITVGNPIGDDRYFRSVFIGMDEVDSAESVSSGFGYFNLEDIHSGDSLVGRIKWRVENGQDYGDFVFERGTGFWEGVCGAIPVRLDWCTKVTDENFDSGDPIALLAFIEGRGTLTLAS